MKHRTASPRNWRRLGRIGVFVLSCQFATLFVMRAPASAEGFSRLPTIDLYPTTTFATGNDEYGSPGGPDPSNVYGAPIGSIASPSAGNSSGGPVQGRVDLNAVISLPIFRGLALQFEHDRAGGIDTTIGRVTNAAHQYIYPASQNDIVDTVRLVYSRISHVSLSGGEFYRYQHNNYGTTDPQPANTITVGPQDWHEWFLTAGFTSSPIAALNGATFGAQVTGEYNRHFVVPSVLATEAAAGFNDSSGRTRFGANYGFNANVPVDRRHGFSVFGSWSDGGFDYFDNNPVPFYYIIVDAGLTKRFSQTLSLTADVNNLTQINNGSWPFIAPNAIHRVYLSIAADIHLAP